VPRGGDFGPSRAAFRPPGGHGGRRAEGALKGRLVQGLRLWNLATYENGAPVTKSGALPLS
jgi:hypothetical protein